MAASMADVIDRVERIKQKLLNKDIKDERALRYIAELDGMLISKQILQETGIGKSVNKLRKREGKLGPVAKLLVDKWRTIVAKESDSVEQKTFEAASTPTKHNKHGQSDSPIETPSRSTLLNGISTHEKSTKSPKTSTTTKETTIKKSTTKLLKLSSSEELSSDHGRFEDMLSLGSLQPLTKKQRKSEKSSPFKKVPIIPQKDILDSLPEIDVDYKPLPPRKYLDSPPNKKMLGSTAVAEGAFNKKNSKTVVYSGKPKFYTGVVPSLFDICVNCLVDNRKMLYEIGGIPFDVLKPVLEKCGPEDLQRIEDYNPYLTEDIETDALWEIHTKRDFKEVVPKEFESWRELYTRLSDEREQRLKKLVNMVKGTQLKKEPARYTKFATAEPPRDVRRRMAKAGSPIVRPVSTSSMAARYSSYHGGGCSGGSSGGSSGGEPRRESAKEKFREEARSLNALSAMMSGVPGHRAARPVKAPLMAKSLKMATNSFRKR